MKPVTGRKALYVAALVVTLLAAGCLSIAQLTAPLGYGTGVPGIAFKEVAAEAGIQFTHQMPTFDPKVNNIMPWLNSIGASVAAVDYNNSGCISFYVTNSGEGSQNAFYENKCDGTFRDIAPALGLADLNQSGVSIGSTWADYNNSGCASLYLIKWGKSELFRNNCDGSFTRVTDEAGVGYKGNPAKAIWLDYNRDGCLDLYLGVYFRPDTNLWQLTTTRIMHDDFERARNGGRNVLYKNNCNGSFTDVSAAMGVDDPGWTLATAAADLNGDGWPDIYNANDFGPDSLYLNQEGKAFRKVTFRGGLGDDTHKGMNIDVGDLYGDGRLALYVSNISKPRYILEGNTVWIAQPDGQWKNVGPELGIDRCGFSWGARFMDIDNDSRLDVFVMNGFVQGKSRNDYWYELGTLATTPGKVVEDAANWPPMGDKGLSGDENKCLFLQQADGTFRDVAKEVGIEATYPGRGVAAIDLFNRGKLDLVLANQGAPLQLFRSEVSNGNNWIKLRLVGRAPSNRDAVGAQVKVTAGNRSLLAERDGGNSFGAQSDPRLHFGLGEHTQADRIEIRWPSGRQQILTDVRSNQILTVEEPDTPVPANR